MEMEFQVITGDVWRFFNGKKNGIFLNDLGKYVQMLSLCPSEVSLKTIHLMFYLPKKTINLILQYFGRTRFQVTVIACL